MGRLPVGFLCLRTNPQVRLFQILQAGRTGDTGEAYLIDSQARLLSPSRFESELQVSRGAVPGWSAFRLWARVPPQSTLPSKLIDKLPTFPATSTAFPLTRMAAALQSACIQEQRVIWRTTATIAAVP